MLQDFLETFLFTDAKSFASNVALKQNLNKNNRIMELDDCRICSEPGQYDLFNDELAFDESNTRMSKIYIVLNNFLYEKVNIY